MVCPLGNVQPTVHELREPDPLVTVTLAWNPPCHWLVMEYVAVHPFGGGGGAGLLGAGALGRGELGLTAGEDGGGEPGVVLFNPRKLIANPTMPLIGSECPAPETLMPSTGACVVLLPYRVRVQPDCGESVNTGVWLTPLRLVHC